MRHITQRHIIICLIYVVLLTWMWLRPLQPLSVDIGGDLRSGLRDLDGSYVRGFWPSEPRPWHPSQGPALRWSDARWAVMWPHTGTGLWKAQLRIDLSGRPATEPATVTWESPPAGQSVLPPSPRIYTMLVRTTNTDSPTIRATVNTFRVSNDSRALGIALTQIRLDAINRSTPGLGFVWWLVCLGWGAWLLRHHTWLGIAISLLATLCMGAFPTWVALHTESGLMLTLAAFAISVVAWHLRPSQWLTIQALVVLCWGQLLALWSPWLISSDIGMHVRMLKQVLSGSLLFTAQLPCEAGAYTSPYPPAVYVLLSPFALLSNDADYLPLLMMTAAMLCNAGAVWYMADVLFSRPGLANYRIWFVVVACVNFPLFRATHIGEMSNAIAHGLVTLACISWLDQRQRIWVPVTLTSVALLAHTGNSITLSMMLGILAILHVVRYRHIPTWRRLVTLAIPVGVTLLYYANFTHLIGQAPGYAGCPPESTLFSRLSSLVHVVPFVLVTFAVVGIVWVRDYPQFVAMLAGFGAALVSIAMLTVSTQTVRWGISVIPFLAIPIAYLMVRMWRHGTAGRVLSITSLSAWIWLTYADMWTRIIQYLHD